MAICPQTGLFLVAIYTLTRHVPAPPLPGKYDDQALHHVAVCVRGARSNFWMPCTLRLAVLVRGPRSLSRCSRYTCSRSAWCTPTRSGTPPIHASHPAASDGEYTISPSGNTFTIYCHNMANQPTEYLTLVHTESAPISGGSRSAGLRLGLTLSPASQKNPTQPPPPCRSIRPS